MRIKFPEHVERPGSVSVGDVTVTIDDEGEASVSREVYAQIAHLDVEIVGYETAEEGNAAAHAATYGEDPAAPSPETIVMHQRDPLGVTLSIRVHPSQVAEYIAQGWSEGAAPSDVGEGTGTPAGDADAPEPAPSAPSEAEAPVTEAEIVDYATASGGETITQTINVPAPEPTLDLAGIILTNDPGRPLFVATDFEIASGFAGAEWIVEDHGDGTATLTPSVNWPGKFHTSNPVTTAILRHEYIPMPHDTIAVVALASEE